LSRHSFISSLTIDSIGIRLLIATADYDGHNVWTQWQSVVGSERITKCVGDMLYDGPTQVTSVIIIIIIIIIIFFPIAVETQGPLSEEPRQLLCDLRRRISASSGDDSFCVVHRPD